MGEYDKAVWVECPKCKAANRPGATIIEVEKGVAVCGVCGHDWKVNR
jgi:transcription elongation factor Elf1